MNAPKNAPKPVSWTELRPLLERAGTLAPHLATMLVALQAALPIVGLIAMQQLIDAVADGVGGRLTAAAAGAAATWAIAFAAGVAMLGSSVQAFRARWLDHHGRALADANVAAVQQHAAGMDLADFDRPDRTEQLQRALADAGSRPVRLTQDRLAVVAALLSLLAMGFLLARLASWLPVLVAAAVLPLALLRQRAARWRLALHEQTLPEQRLTGVLGSALVSRPAAKDLRLRRLVEPFGERLRTLRAALRQRWRQLGRRTALAELAVQALAGGGLFAAYWWLLHEALTGRLSLGGLVLQAQAAQRTQNALRDLIAARAAVFEQRLFLRPLVEFLGRQPEVVVTPPPVPPPPGPIAFAAAALAFRYPEQSQPVLRDLTFAIGAGERVAIVGSNGAGKSTLLKLLARLYDPTAGTLRCGAVDLRRVPPAALWARTAALWQDSGLLELSLADNLGLGAPGGPDTAAVERALTAVGMRDAVQALPLGLATVCSRRWPGGVDWSAGQAKRLLLARALAQPADLLLLDEPLAHLDADAAAAVLAALAALPRQRTVVVVDHDPAVRAWADRVLVLNAGALRAEPNPGAAST